MSTESRRLGKYELRQRLAGGGQGEVWKAFDLQLRRYVAIKQLNANMQNDPDFVARFEREAQFIASLRHPNIVKIHDFQFVAVPGAPTSIAYMVMEYIEGQNLADYIRTTSRQQRFPSAADVIALFTPISLALDYAHQRGMLHRDIKPANIMLDQRNPSGRSMGEPILTDFGIAKLQGGAADTTKVLGTPLYLSPEQARGLNGDERSDLYSLGIVLYEVLAGVTPFRNAPMMALLMQHYQDAPPPPETINPAITPQVSSVVLKSIAKDPDARFPSASAMTIALAEALKVPIPSVLRSPDASTASIHTSHAQTRPDSSHAQGHAAPVLHGDATLYPATYILPPPLPGPSKKAPAKKRLLVLSLALVAVIVLGTAAVFALRGTPTAGKPPVPVTTTAVGQLRFLRSSDATGTLDTLQVSLSTLQDAPSGMSYYAWLVTHDDSLTPTHWSFAAQHGTLSPDGYTQPQHENLLTIQPYLFLITQERGNTTIPSLDAHARLYYASIPQAKSSVNHYSLVNLLNFLLTSDPHLEQLGLPYGLRYWLLKNTLALATEANAVKASWQQQQVKTVRQHLVNSLSYLTGTSCLSTQLQAMPQGTPTTPDTALMQAASVSLLDCSRNTTLAGLLSATDDRVQGIAQAPGITAYQKTQTSQLPTATASIRTSLGQLQQVVLQLLQKTDAQLLQSTTQPLIEQLVTLARASSGQPISDTIQHLATFDLFTCPQSSSNTICMS